MCASRTIFSVFLSFLLFFVPACIYKKSLISSSIKPGDYVPVFIHMPKSSFVFENVSPILYQALFEHFQQVGHALACSQQDGYTLHVTIKKLDPYQKYVSPDVLPFHTEIRLEIECKLYNFAQKLIVEKNFTLSTLISKPRNPILTSDFMIFEYQKLMRRAAARVEQFFRPFLKDK